MAVEALLNRALCSQDLQRLLLDASDEQLVALGSSGGGDEVQEVTLEASVDGTSGSIVWSPVPPDEAVAAHFRTKRWHKAMLRDGTRNKKYEEAIAAAVRRFKRQRRALDLDGAMDGRQRGPHVLDVGTGTGLLAMMAARHGAASVTGCEMVTPLATS